MHHVGQPQFHLRRPLRNRPPQPAAGRLPGHRWSRSRSAPPTISRWRARPSPCFCCRCFILALIAGVSYATYWHAVENISLFEHTRSRTAMVLYGAPLLAGLVLVFFLVKPLLARRGKAPDNRALSREDEPLLHDFVARICAVVGAPAPSRIEVDCRVNASAHLRRGWRSLFGKSDLVLTIGLLAGRRPHPRAAGRGRWPTSSATSPRVPACAQLRGAHRQRLVLPGGLRTRPAGTSSSTKRANADAGWGIGAAVALARGVVWLSRKLLAGLMHVGHAISSYLMRQMEFDADRYEARLVGAEVFVQTCHELSYLNAAFQSSLGDVGLAPGATASWPTACRGWWPATARRLDGELLNADRRAASAPRRPSGATAIRPTATASLRPAARRSRRSFASELPAEVLSSRTSRDPPARRSSVASTRRMALTDRQRRAILLQPAEERWPASRACAPTWRRRRGCCGCPSTLPAAHPAGARSWWRQGRAVEGAARAAAGRGCPAGPGD